MANEEQLNILRGGIHVWNRWRVGHFDDIDFEGADLRGADLRGADLSRVYLKDANLSTADLKQANLRAANLRRCNFSQAMLNKADLSGAILIGANFTDADLTGANLNDGDLSKANFTRATLATTNFSFTRINNTIFAKSDLSNAVGLENVFHDGPSIISTDTFPQSKGRIPLIFLRGCGLSDWEIEESKLYNPDLSNEQVNKILYTMYDLRAGRALQISPLFISYNHKDSQFVDKIGGCFTEKGIRYWRDVHDMKAGRIEKQVDRAIRQNPTVLLVLSKHSIKSDWVEHEVRTARALEKEVKRDVLCPVALDDSWQDSPWPERIMEQIMEYHILDFSEWTDPWRFGAMFSRLIDGLQLFYKG